MHSSVELKSEDFEIAIAGEPAAVADLLPGFEEGSRLGIVLRDDFGAVGASGLILAAVTAFYDIQRDRHPEGFYRYADYFLFHVGRIRGNHNELDVFPDHKEVVVADDPEDLLRAINDRGVTHLVVPEGQRRAAEFQPMTVNAARERIRAALLYSPSGRVADPDVEIKGNGRVDYYVWATLDAAAWADELEAEGKTDPKAIAWVRSRLGEVDDEVAAAMLAARAELEVDGRTVETLRRIAVDEALELLSPNPVEEKI